MFSHFRERIGRSACRLIDLASGFVGLRPFADFASQMELEMDASNPSPGRKVVGRRNSNRRLFAPISLLVKSITA